MPLPSVYNITVYKGDTFEMEITLVDSAGTAIDLSTATTRMQIRKKTGGVLLVNLAQDVDLFIVGNVVTISKVISLEPGEYEYDLESTFPDPPGDDIVRTYVKGTFTVVGDISSD